MNSDSWKLLYRSPMSMEVSLLKKKLEDNAIDAVVMNKRDSMYNYFGEIELLVPADMYQVAKDVLDTFKSNME